MTLVGPAGVGKTTLAAEAARALLDRTPDGAWLVELGPLRAAGEVLPAVGNALGIRRVGTGGEGDRDALGVLRERLRAARLLVVLDGAEHLVPDLGPVVGDLAAAGRDVSVLVTSRRPLGSPARRSCPCARSTPPPPRSCSWSALARRSPTGSPTRPRARPSPRSVAASTACRWRSNWPPRGCGRCRRPRSPSGSSAASASSGAAALCRRRSRPATPC